MNKPSLSIIIPAYNAQDTISVCLKSILRQNDISQYEIIVIDDGSTDNTADIVRNFQYRAPNIRLISQPNRGVSTARNVGINESTAEFITFVDADDAVGIDYQRSFKNVKLSDCYDIKKSKTYNLLHLGLFLKSDLQTHIDFVFEPDYFRKMLDPMQSNADIDVAMAGKMSVCQEMNYVGYTVYSDYALFNRNPTQKHNALLQADCRENANFAIYRHSLLDKHNIRFIAKMPLDEDMLFCETAVLHAKYVLTIPDCTYLYFLRQNTLSMVNCGDKRHEKQSIAWRQRFSIFLQELGKYPEYAQLYSYWLKMFATLMHMYPQYNIFNSLPIQCGMCDAETCTQCPFHNAAQSVIQNNIGLFVTKTK